VNPAYNQGFLLGALGYAVFERTGQGSFELLGPSPDWLPAGSLTEAMPFLEVFLPDAEEFWKNPGNRPALRSDFWTQTGAGGIELHFSATALAGDRQFLLVECVEQRFQQTQSFIQYAHDASLARDKIAKLSIELEHATQAKSEFLARMSHEIRTPMNALLGMAELLWETELSREQREYVRVCRASGDNLLNIVNDILDFSKVEAGQIELEKITFSLADIVKEALDIAGVRARAKGLAVNSRIEPAVPAYLVGDPGRLRQILLNLLGNATKFTERGELSVLVELEAIHHRMIGGWKSDHCTLHFSVSDTGIGIPADRLSTIFDSFSQADASITRKFGGTGLGLSISKRLVELMGGKIWAESTPGLGTTMHFTARFPVAEAACAAEADARKPLESAQPLLRPQALRILLADDVEENRFLIRNYLKESACIIDEVENGALALEKFKQQVYDVVLIDSEMPVLDGYSATRAMRAFEKEHAQASTPILALTAHALREARDRSLEAGCTDHLTKPIRKATLVDAINRFVPMARAVDRIEVSVESWLKPVVGGYLENRRGDVAKLRAALEGGDYATIRTLGHQMTGTGGAYGFEPITEIGSALEESALASDTARMRTSIEDLDRYLSAVRVE
jgi:signal transduction histidine kinase/AmiR/NasT family two-component response regulator